MNEATQNSTVFEFLRSGEVGSRLLSLIDGQMVFAPGDPAADLYFPEAGEIRLFQPAGNGQKTLTAILGLGELFGIPALRQPAVHAKFATSVGDSKVRAVPAKCLFSALVSRGDLAVEFIGLLTGQLNHAWTEASEPFSHDCRYRVIQKLLEFANSPAAQWVSGGVELHITHTELAQAIGAARETVSICLMDLKRGSLVHTRRNRVIYDPDRLAQI